MNVGLIFIIAISVVIVLFAYCLIVAASRDRDIEAADAEQAAYLKAHLKTTTSRQHGEK